MQAIPLEQTPLIDPRPYRVVTERVKVNGREMTTRGIELSLHPGQQRAYDSTARVVAVLAGTQGGKTTFGPWWLYREITQAGPGDYLAVTATYDLFKLKMLPALREVFEHTLGIARYWAGDAVLELCEHTLNPKTGAWEPQPGHFRAKQATDPMWGRVILRSAAAEGGLESSTAKAAWLDEAGMEEFGITAWEAIMRRLSLHRGRILITTTPYYNTGWLKREVFDRWAQGDQSIEVIQFPSIMNPAFPKAEFDERQRTMEGWKFSMFYKGEFERPAGLIYSDYRDEPVDLGGHVCVPFAIPSGWPMVLGVDPGAVHCCLLYGALDPNTGALFIVKERMMPRVATNEIFGLVKADAEVEKRPLSAYYVGGYTDTQARMDWMSAGAHPVYGPPFADVESGIERVVQLLRGNRFRVFSTCMGLRDEFLDYRRKLDDSGLPLEEIVNKNRYHFLDTLRYIAIQITTVRTVVYAPAPQLLQEYRGD